MRYFAVVVTLALVAVTSTASAQVQGAETRAAEAPRQVPAAEEAAGWWTPWYFVDYGITAAGLTTYLIAGKLGPTRAALTGPQFSEDNPTAIFDPQLAERIGRMHADEDAGETVPVVHAIYIAAGAGAALAVEETLSYLSGADPDAQRLHDTLMGYIEGAAVTGGATEVVKVMVGRLRPDFQDRAARHLCNTNPPDGFDCTEHDGRPLHSDPAVAEEIFEDGRKSFWSGHSAFAFSTMTYMSFAIGGRWVWGDRATPASRAVGTFLQTAFMATAAFIAGSRLDDGRHHVTDVLVGSTVGIGIASVSYWRRFDSEGNPHNTKSKFRFGPGPGDAGLSLMWIP